MKSFSVVAIGGALMLSLISAAQIELEAAPFTTPRIPTAGSSFDSAPGRAVGVAASHASAPGVDTLRGRWRAAATINAD